MTSQSRREFLENSMFAAAAAGAFAPFAAARAEDEKSSGDTGEKLRVVVVGVNGRGGSHIDGFGSRKDCEIAAIVDVDENVGNKRADAIEKKFGKRPKVYTDMRKAYEDDSYHIASIATPNHWHALAAIWAIQAGKDVYCEKPVSHNVSEGRRIVEAARKYNKIVQTGTQSRSNPGLRKAIDYVHAGKLGEVKLARGLCYKPRGSIGPKGNYDVPASVDYNLWSGPAPELPLSRKQFHYDWHWQWAYGNGDLGNQGIHQMDIARWALGADSVGDSVMSYGGRFGYEDAGETANTQVCVHTFGDKKLVFEVRGLKTDAYKGAKVGVIVYGTEGYMVIPSYSEATVFDRDGKEVERFSGGGDHHHYANFVEAVRARDPKKLNADIEEGHRSSALCHLGNISYRLGSQKSADELKAQLEGNDEALDTLDRTVQHLEANGVKVASIKFGVGPKLQITEKEEFTGELADKANPMLTREYRAPFVVPKTADL